METKRLILYIIRIQSGANLLDILVRPITAEDDDKWLALLDEEFLNQNEGSRKRSPYASSIVENPASTLIDVTSMSYAELKSVALENILELERHGRVSRHNQYQDILNHIAIDIRTKHKRRVQRAHELEGVRATLAQLDSKAAFLDEQLQSYNDYVEQAMLTLQNKKGKKRFLLPFTKQYNHEKELAKSGRTPKFGSYKYSARARREGRPGVLDRLRRGAMGPDQRHHQQRRGRHVPHRGQQWEPDDPRRQRDAAAGRSAAGAVRQQSVHPPVPGRRAQAQC